MVSASGWTVVALCDLPRVPGLRDIEWLPLQRALRLSTFGANVFVVPIGTEVDQPHDESSEDDQEVFYLVLAGSVQFELGEEALNLHRDQVVDVRDRSVRRRATSLEPGSLRRSK